MGAAYKNGNNIVRNSGLRCDLELLTDASIYLCMSGTSCASAAPLPTQSFPFHSVINTLWHLIYNIPDDTPPFLLIFSRTGGFVSID